MSKHITFSRFYVLKHDVAHHHRGEVYGMQRGGGLYLLRAEYASRLAADPIQRAEDYRLWLGHPVPRDSWLYFADNLQQQPDEYRQVIVNLLDNPTFIEKVR